MFARYGTCDGFSKCPLPCRESAATRWSPTLVRNTGPDGLPNGVSTSTASPPSAPNASPSPEPPMMPTIDSWVAMAPVLAAAGRSRHQAGAEVGVQPADLVHAGHARHAAAGAAVQRPRLAR